MKCRGCTVVLWAPGGVWTPGGVWRTGGGLCLVLEQSLITNVDLLKLHSINHRLCTAKNRSLNFFFLN